MGCWIWIAGAIFLIFALISLLWCHHALWFMVVLVFGAVALFVYGLLLLLQTADWR